MLCKREWEEAEEGRRQSRSVQKRKQELLEKRKRTVREGERDRQKVWWTLIINTRLIDP